LGVLHQGEVVHQANFGFRHVDAGLPPDDDTVYVVCSLTKAITAAMVGILVDEGKLSWTTQLHQILPEFQRAPYDPANNITVTDLLSHRTGLPSYDSFWLSSHNKIPIPRAEAVALLSYVPTAADLRTEFIYNNLGYEILGQLIEKVSGTKFSTFMTNSILKPLNMTRTFYTTLPSHFDNVAQGYTALQNASVFPVPPPIYGDDVLMGPAGGVRSSVHDLLILYSAFIDAANSEIENRTPIPPLNPLRQLSHIFQGMVSVPLATLREVSYASGWLRVQLPAPVGLGRGPGIDPMLGEGLPSRLGLFHEGNIPGFTTFTAIFPETRSAVVVLSNSLGLTDTTKLVGQLLIEELFGNTINSTDYTAYAALAAKQAAATMSEIKSQLIHSRDTKAPYHSLPTYTGTFYNSIHNFFINISASTGQLRVHFMGDEGFVLHPYQCNSFFWSMSHDELVQLARYTSYPMEYYIIEFGYVGNDGDSTFDTDSDIINALRWKHEFSVQVKGEIFRMESQRHEPFDQRQQQSVLTRDT
jgi:CubicO group peptidase (beta-lactamase class C family)